MPKAAKTALIARLRLLRKRHGLTQWEFSSISGIGYKYYQHIEEGQNVDLRLSTLTKLANAYGIRVHQLLAPSMPTTKVATNEKR